MAKRVSKHWEYNHRYDVDKFDLSNIDKNNLVNHMLKLTQQDVSSNMIMELFGSFNGSSLCNHYDTFTVPIGAFNFIDEKGKMKSNTNKFVTTFGIWVFNIFFLQGFNLSSIFGGYVNENIGDKQYEKMHQKILYAMMEDKVTTETYKQFIEYCNFIMPWETILCPSHTEKILSCTKEINKMKAKLIEENKEALDNGDAVVAERIEKELIDFALEYLKDDPSLDPYLSGAGGNLKNNFKNMYIMKGAIRNPDPTAKKQFNIATSSFIDGITTDEYSMLANSLAGGPYSRAKKTEIGGYWEKLIAAATNTITIDGKDTDCGSDKYIEVVLTENLSVMFMYSYIIKPDGSLEELTSENLSKYLNKKVKFRSTLFCKSETGGVCHRCAGNFFYRRGNNRIGLACASIPTVLKLKSMKAFHDSTINTTEIDPMRAFGLKKI